MEVKYDISKYLTSVRMSSKKRVLVEGKTDKEHILNLFRLLLGDSKIKIDTADNIKADCSITSKNSRAKIDKIHNHCKSSNKHNNLYFLRDREFYKFEIGEEVLDLMSDHENDGNLSWTLGHSIENYFLDSELIADAFSYLTSYHLKVEALELFRDVLPSALRVVASITLAAKEMNKCSYPIGVIGWQDFNIEKSDISFNYIDWNNTDHSKLVVEFRNAMLKNEIIVSNSKALIHSRICRGHTSILMLQRIFSACIYNVGEKEDKILAKKEASRFSQIKEVSISCALGEAWIRLVKSGSRNYPTNLISSITSPITV
jgi:hypothetical protein